MFDCKFSLHIQVLPNLTSKKRSKVEDLQRKLAERDESRHSTAIGRPENTTSSKFDVKVQVSSSFLAWLCKVEKNHCHQSDSRSLLKYLHADKARIYKHSNHAGTVYLQAEYLAVCACVY